jgi:hypothetical protein
MLFGHAGIVKPVIIVNHQSRIKKFYLIIFYLFLVIVFLEEDIAHLIQMVIYNKL